MRGTAIPSITLAALLMTAAPALAQSPCPGQISANVFAPVPRDAAIAVPDRTGGGPTESALKQAVLAALGCEEYQGFLIARPLATSALEAFFASHPA